MSAFTNDSSWTFLLRSYPTVFQFFHTFCIDFKELSPLIKGPSCSPYHEGACPPLYPGGRSLVEDSREIGSYPTGSGTDILEGARGE